MTRPPTPYTAPALPRRESAEQLRARIPGWGVDLDPRDRPSTPKLDPGLSRSDGQGGLPERQPETRPRERSVEHGMLPPVFGTAQPLHGVSGALRRLAYARFSEARNAHWLLLVLGDRVDAIGAHARSLLTLRPDQPLTQTGVRAEITRSGPASRTSERRADRVHHLLDPVVVVGPWVLAAVLGRRAVRALLGAARR